MMIYDWRINIPIIISCFTIGAMIMPEESLSIEERQYLLKLARLSIERAVRGEPLPSLEIETLSPNLKAPGVVFVTLTLRGELRGCIGALEPTQPLVDDVREHAIASAQQDYRFPPVREAELSEIVVEISRLTTPSPLEYTRGEELLSLLKSGVDGVILRDGWRKATFLPQVWEKLPDAAEFLSHLCYKMGAPPDLWRRKKLEVLIYQVEEFHE
jgi:AmmeMemoRadiSam system protein A